ncbi:MAG TPA: sigma-70 family RNA polymerase sigma factor [Planctomycetota bacterium]|nr:sigma-70 family RNA polymerase sigma factor [Planctomycetota bacterium]
MPDHDALRILERVTVEPETRWSLIARAADGDAEARNRFGALYMPLVRSFFEARWRHSWLAAEVADATQEVFVDCFRPNGALGRADAARGEFRGFLFGVVRNVALRFESRARTRERGSGVPTPELADDEPRASVMFDRVWSQDLMRRAGERMRALAEVGDDGMRQRMQLLGLRFTEGLPIRTIAARWGVDADVLHRAYARAREEFKQCLRSIVAEHAVRTEADLDAECRRIFDGLS